MLRKYLHKNSQRKFFYKCKLLLTEYYFNSLQFQLLFAGKITHCLSLSVKSVPIFFDFGNYFLNMNVYCVLLQYLCYLVYYSTLLCTYLVRTKSIKSNIVGPPFSTSPSITYNKIYMYLETNCLYIMT